MQMHCLTKGNIGCLNYMKTEDIPQAREGTSLQSIYVMEKVQNNVIEEDYNKTIKCKNDHSSHMRNIIVFFHTQNQFS